MPKLVFDVNEGDTDEWDDEDFDCEGRAAIELHARRLIKRAGLSQIARGSGGYPSTVVVYDDNGTVIMSAHGRHGGSVRVLWDQEQPDAAAGQRPEQQHGNPIRAHARGVLLNLLDHLSEGKRQKA